MGPLMYSEDDGEVFLGRSPAIAAKSVSGNTAKLSMRKYGRSSTSATAGLRRFWKIIVKSWR